MFKVNSLIYFFADFSKCSLKTFDVDEYKGNLETFFWDQQLQIIDNYDNYHNNLPLKGTAQFVLFFFFSKLLAKG